VLHGTVSRPEKSLPMWNTSIVKNINLVLILAHFTSNADSDILDVACGPRPEACPDAYRDYAAQALVQCH
jgi:hypothetical protein